MACLPFVLLHSCYDTGGSHCITLHDPLPFSIHHDSWHLTPTSFLHVHRSWLLPTYIDYSSSTVPPVLPFHFLIRAVSIYIDNAPDLHCPACPSATYVRIYLADFTASMTNIMIDLRWFLERSWPACEEKGSCM